MLHQTGIYIGIDTCSDTIMGNFYIEHILSAEAEFISITNFPDINSSLRKLRQEDIIYAYVETGKREFYSCLSSKIDDSKYRKMIHL